MLAAQSPWHRVMPLPKVVHRNGGDVELNGYVGSDARDGHIEVRFRGRNQCLAESARAKRRGGLSRDLSGADGGGRCERILALCVQVRGAS